MKYRIFLCALLAIGMFAQAQVEVTNGPAQDNDRDSKLNRLIKGEKGFFYAYRVRSKGKGTSFFVEKYDGEALKPVFSKEIELNMAENKAKIEDVEFAEGNVFVFVRKYFKEEQKMTLYYQTVSKDGEIAPDLTEIISVTSDHYQFVDFDVFPNPASTKFVLKASHKANKEDEFKTDFLLFNAGTKSVEWTKTVNRELHSNSNSKGANVAVAAALGGSLGAAIAKKASKEDIGFIGLMLDEKDNVYFGYTEEEKTSKEEDSRYTLSVGVFKNGSNEAAIVDLKFEKDFYVKDIEFAKTNDGEVTVGGFVKDIIERKGMDYFDVGIFSFVIDANDNSVKSSNLKMFDKEMLTSLMCTKFMSRRYNYKLDYIMPVGDDVFFIGEQYMEDMTTQSSGYVTTTLWRYTYMDVIVAKMNASGEFEWVKNVPLRNIVELRNFPHLFKQYIAIPYNQDIYIMANDHPKNMATYSKPGYSPAKLKSVVKIHGSDFVCSQISTADGSIKHSLVFNNEDYCFAPIQERNTSFMPPTDTEIFAPAGDGEIYIYTEDRGVDRFSKLKFK